MEISVDVLSAVIAAKKRGVSDDSLVSVIDQLGEGQEKMEYSKEFLELQEAREDNQSIMHDLIERYHHEMMAKEKPSSKHLDKFEFIKAWVSIFDSSFCLDGDDELCKKELYKHSIKNLRESFEWVQMHFYELDLGCGGTWYEALKTVLRYKARSTWGIKTEQKVYLKFSNLMARV